MTKSGIYQIFNVLTGMFYIGSAVDFNRRFKRHKRLLNTNKHPNAHLQAAWNRYGERAFEFKIIQYLENLSLLVPVEQKWLDFTKSHERHIGYNICKIADSRTGILHSEDTKLKIAATNKGRVKTKEHQAKITAAITGKKRAPEVGKAQSERLKGRIISEATRLAMSKGQTGRKHSEESKLKRSLALKGVSHAELKSRRLMS